MGALKNRLTFYKSKVGQRGITDWRQVARASHYWSRSLAAAKRRSACNPWHGDRLRWIEKTDAVGLRFVCFADQEITYLRNQGYYADNYGDEVLRGAVWRLPARGGQEMFVYGYGDPNNEDAALICFVPTDDRRAAAQRADGMAEKAAEDSREFYVKDRAEQDILQAREEIHDINASALQLLHEIKAAGSRFSPAICNALKTQVRALLEERRAQFKIIAARKNDFLSAAEC